MSFTSSKFGSFRTVIFTLFILAVIAAIFTVPFQLRSKAAGGLFPRTESHEQDLPNYDIRTDKTAFDKLAAFRVKTSKTAVEVADVRDSFVRGEIALKQSIPTLKVEYNNDIRIPEVIGTDVKQGKAFLTRASKLKHAAILSNFLTDNAQLIGASEKQIGQLKVAADYQNPENDLSFVELNQEINGIPVFRGEIKAGFTRKGEVIRVINNFAPGLDYDTLPNDFGDPLAAVTAASAYINLDGSKLDLNNNKSDSTGLKAVFGTGDSATTAEKMYFPTEPGVAVPAWRVLIWRPVNAYYIIVDAQTGAMLWRKNITEDQTQSATYGVYSNPNAMINVAHAPNLMPILATPAPDGSQGVRISRTPITRVGNEALYTFNNLGWIPDGVLKTDGNAVQAGLDRDGTDGVDTNSEAVSPTRNFDFTYDPYNAVTNLGENPVAIPQTYPGSIYQQGVITQLFYICNWYHDETYRLGFTEAARNFQNDNFGRGGLGGDRVRGEGQDSSGTNNANFSAASDGTRGRMQMFIFDGPNPDIDGSLDADVVVHEFTHGLSNRLHGNGSGLVNDMSRGMGEGWSDFYGLSLLSQPSDPVNAIYATGTYATYRFQGTSYVNNGFYGIRRFPYAVKSYTGGPQNRPYNPLTFADIDGTTMDLTDGAFPRGQVGGSNGDEVHNSGEIWCSMLWEFRGKMVTRLGWSVGNRKALQIVTDGMKLAPLSPTFIQERDAILAAANAGGVAADVADIWAGFAARGLGASAGIQNVGGTSVGGTGTTRVTEAFDLPNVAQSPDVTISDAAGNASGFPDPGETVALTIPLTNTTGNTATGVTLQIPGGNSVSYGNIPSGTTATRTINYTVPMNTSCGGQVALYLNVTSSLGPVSFPYSIAVGAPVTTFTQNFDSVTAPAIPAGWTVTNSYAPMAFVSTTVAPDSGVNSMFAADLPNCASNCTATDGGSTELTSPVIPVTAGAAILSFRHKYNTEFGWDGGVLEISFNGGLFQEILSPGSQFLQNGYNGTMGVSSPNPLGGRRGWTGDSGGYVTTVVRLPVDAAGQNIQLRWRFGADNNGAPLNGGWNVDTVQLAGSYACSAVPNVELSGRVMTDTESGLRNAVVKITGSSGYSRVATTSSFGFYQFTDVPPGQTYTITIASRLYRFAAQVVPVSGNALNVDFVGQQ